MRVPAVYIMANCRNGTLYVGVTSNLVARAYQHRTGAIDGFTRRYGCTLLVWFEPAGDMLGAIAREKQLKGGSRARKIALIASLNPEWRDLYPDIANSFQVAAPANRHCERSEAIQRPSFRPPLA